MKLSRLIGERVKNVADDLVVKSHIYMQKAGYIKQVSAGIYSLLTPAKKSINKIEQIIREEMDKIGGQEVLFPVVMPRELWEESGRYSSIGEEMARFKDRNNRDFVLGMTHEEAAVHLVRGTVKSYDQLPFMIYQMQTKFRDEARPRAGLIRVKEFTMKDAYSFHENQTDLEKYYQEAYDAYVTIFKRIGMKNFISVKSDSGMMGGKVADEFMLITPSGEDSLVLCKKCDYKTNLEVAEGILEKDTNKKEEKLKLVDTKEAKSIEDICKFFNIEPKDTCKAVCYAVKGDNDKTVVVFIRGDLEVNELKVRNIVKEDVFVKELSENDGVVAGYIGPINKDGKKSDIFKNKNIEIFFDSSLKGESNLVCGANIKGFHIKGLSFNRDLKDVQFNDLFKVKDGMTCPKCGVGKLYLTRGIEIGNIFQLGTKYTKSMGMTVHTSSGEEMHPIMGCYGIGVGRALASVLEETSDEKGLVFPYSIAPWHVYLCPLRYDNEVIKKETDKLYKDLQDAGIEVLLDDRLVSPGVKFADSELMGIPLRIVVSEKSLAANGFELSHRASGEKEIILKQDILKIIKEIIAKNI